jgi:hypothetical protein
MKTPFWLLAAFLSVLAATLPAQAQWQKIGKEQLPSNLGDVLADTLTAPKIKAYNASGTDHYLYIGNDSGTSSEGFRLRFDASGGQAYLYARNSLRFQFDSSNIYARDPLDFFDGDSLSWNFDDGSIGYNSSSNQFRMEDAADAAMILFDMDDGSIDAAGPAEFGDGSHTLSTFQAASEGTSDMNSSGTPDVAYDGANDCWHPRQAGVVCYVNLPCPLAAPGTRIKSVKVMVLLSSSSEIVNFAVSRASTGSPGTIANVLGFAASDYTDATATSITGSYYYVLRNTDYTLADNNKIWVRVRLKSAVASDDCRFYGAEWTFEQRKY